MYNSNTISAFIERVNREAEREAQKVFDKYQAEFIERCQRQMLTGDKIGICSGSAFFQNKELDNNFLTVIANIQYTEQRACFDVSTIEK